MASRIPIRWRLTLWYVAILIVALAILSGAFYFGLRLLLYDSLESDLRSHAALVQGAVTEADGRPQLMDGPGVTPDDDDQFVRLFDVDGQQVAALGDDVEDAPSNAAGVAEAAGGSTNIRWIEDDDERFRILSQPVLRDGTIIGVLEVGIESEVDETLAFALRLIAIATPLLAAFATIGGVWLAGRALRPVDEITGLARNISDQDLSQRLDLKLPNDELGRLAATFNAMLDRLEASFTRQRQFTADAAHELRTPLALLQTQIEIALEQPRSADADQAVLESLAADLERLSRLSAALLALARGDAQGIELTLEPVDLPALLEVIRDQYIPLADDAGVEIALDTEPVTITADQDRLIQILVNLIDNALRHSPPNTTITLGAEPTPTGARLWVQDEGPGIAPEHLPHLFNRFYRIDPGRTRATSDGIGLGLSITQMLAEAHGGTISIESQVGEGTKVIVNLPSDAD